MRITTILLCPIVLSAFFLSFCGPAGEEKTATLILKNAGKIQGRLVDETPEQVVIEWQGGDVAFSRNEIAEIRYGEELVKEKEGIQLPDFEAAPNEEAREFAPTAYPKVILTKGQEIRGAEIRKVGETFFVKEKFEGGGAVEYEFPSNEVEQIELWPPMPFEELGEHFRMAQETYSKMAYFRRVPYHILSDSESSDLVMYLKTIQRFQREFVKHFFDILDVTQGKRPLTAVIFANHEEFLKLAGSPNVVGFYVPSKRILFLYNVKEQELLKFYFSWLADLDNFLDDLLEAAEEDPTVSEEEKSQINLLRDWMKEAIEKERMELEWNAREETMETIRHEGAHQLLHLFGIDTDEVHRGAWLSEGFASYLEAEPIGELNDGRLMALRYELQKGGKLMPLGYLLSVRSLGGVHGLDPGYAVFFYHQSWAFIYFLMNTYPPGFYGYLREIGKQGKDFNMEMDVALLEKNVGRSLKEMEVEFETFVGKLIEEKIDPKKYEDYEYFRIRTELLSAKARSAPAET